MSHLPHVSIYALILIPFVGLGLGAFFTYLAGK